MPHVESSDIHDFSVFLSYAHCPLINLQRRVETLENMFTLQKELLKKKIERSLTSKSISPSSIIEYREFESLFYQPKIYHCFGEFDLLMMCLIEGFDMGSSLNTSYSYLQAGEDLNYPDNLAQTHISLGATYKLHTHESIENVYRKIHPTSNKQPLIGIIELKINDFLLLENGIIFSNKFIEYLKKQFKHIHIANSDFLILQRNSWSELSVIIFCSAYTKIKEVLTNLNNLTCSAVFSKSDLPVEMQKHYENIKNELFLIKTNTTLGFDSKIVIDDDMGIINSINDNDLIHPVSQFTFSPGVTPEGRSLVEKVFTKHVKNKLNKDKLYLATFGRGDITFDYGKISTKKFIAVKKDLFSEIEGSPELFKEWFIEKTFTTISAENERGTKLEGNKKETIESAFIKLNRKSIKALLFNAKQLKQLRNQLKNLLVSHQLKDSLIRMYTLYNNGIGDVILFSRFIELHPFLDDLLIKIERLNLKFNNIYEPLIIKNTTLENPHIYNFEHYTPEDIGKLHVELDRIVHSFHYAFQNRYHASYITRSLYDTNLFFHGGVHEKISCMDTLYKSACKLLGNEKSLVYVESSILFNISINALVLNKSYLFKPELLAALYVQEVANQAYFRRSIRKSNEKLFIFHQYNPDSTWNIKAALEENERKNILKQSLKFKDLFHELVDQEFLEHVFADIIGYYTLYNSDYDLFEFWYWMTLSAHPNKYEINNGLYKIKKNEYLRLLLRYLIVIKTCNPEKYRFITEHFDYWKVRTPYLKNKTAKYINLLCKEFINSYFNNGIFHSWCENVKHFAKQGLKTTSSSNCSQPHYQLCKKSLGNEKQIFHLCKKFRNGENLSFEKIDLSSISPSDKHFFLCRNISYLFLKVIHNEVKFLYSSNVGCTNYMLKREPMNQADEIHIDYSFETNDSFFLSDPVGGNYITHPALRRKMFKYRNLYYRYLSDLSNKEKGLYVKRLIHRSS